MSIKLDKTRIGENLDRRIKIPKSEYPVILALYKNGEFIRAIARRYHVDHRLIQFILFPERQKKNYQHRLERGGSKQYYDKGKWKEVMREHRHYKRTLINKGLIC